MCVNSEVRSQPACGFFQLHGLSSLQDFRVPYPFTNGGASQFRRMTGMPMILSPDVLSVVPEIMAPYRARCNGLLDNRNTSPTSTEHNRHLSYSSDMSGSPVAARQCPLSMCSMP
jgi:hypothetical protein